MPAHKNRTKAEREAQLEKVAGWFCEGVRQSEMAERLGVEQSQISYDLRILMARWAKASTEKIDAFKAAELERINHLERTYWQAWLDSCESAVKVSKEKRVGSDVVTNRQEIEKPTGNPTFLQGVERCIEKRCKLMGLDAPQRTELSGPNGGPIEMNVDAKDRLAQLLSRVAEREPESRDNQGSDE